MSQDPSRQPGLLGTLVGLLLGLAGAVLIWTTTPYNNFVIGNSPLVDSYLPTLVLFLVLLLVLAVNPLLRCIHPGLQLTSRQLALAVGVMLIACVLPGQGLLRSLPYSLAKVAKDVSDSKVLAEEYGKMDLPPGMFPDRVGLGQDTPAADGYIHELQPGQAIPWRAWAGPLATWGVFLLACWLMMVGLGMIVLPQWRHNERLAFPLLTVQQALIEGPEPGRQLPPLLRRTSFWIAVGVVFVVHLLIGANTYYPEKVPTIPMRWDFTSLFAEEPFRQMPGYIRFGRLYFLFMGIAFFMPTRISFSIWFFLVVYGMYRCFAPVFGIGYYIEKTDDQRLGAVVALTMCVLWLGRAHWKQVLASLMSSSPSDENRYNRKAAATFLLGLAGMFAWFVWAGAPPVWAMTLAAFAFMLALLVTRIVAETGAPFIRLYENPMALMRLAPVPWLTGVSVLMAGAVDMLFAIGGRVSPATMAAHAIALDPDASARQQSRRALGFIGLLVVGLVIAGAAHLLTSYHHSTSLDGQPIHAFRESVLDEANKSVLELSRGQLSEVPYNRYAHLGFGAALAVVLYYLCLTLPQWPVHPFGLMLVDSHFGHTIWASVFIGWAVQRVIVHFGGARLYRLARPFFLGLIVGEVVASIFWALTPIVLVAMNKPYKAIHVLPT